MEAGREGEREREGEGEGKIERDRDRERDKERDAQNRRQRETQSLNRLSTCMRHHNKPLYFGNFRRRFARYYWNT